MVTYVEALDEYERKKAKFDVSHILRKIHRMKFILANVFDLTGVKDQQLILPILAFLCCLGKLQQTNIFGGVREVHF